MVRMGDLRGQSLRRHRRLVRRVAEEYRQHQNPTYLTRWYEFRMAERLHRAGLIACCVSRHSWAGTAYPFREIAAFPSMTTAMQSQYGHLVLPRKPGSRRP